MARKKQTQAQKLYNKELKRIKQFISRAEKRGYSFNDKAIPERPKNVTMASVRKLQKIKPDTLYKKAVYGGEASYGEIVKGTKGRQLERSQASKRASLTRKIKVQKQSGREVQQRYREKYNIKKDFIAPVRINTEKDFFAEVIISNYKAHVRQYNDKAVGVLLAWLDRLLATNTRDDVAEMLEKGANDGLIVNHKIVYDDVRMNQYISAMLDYLPEAGELYREEILEAFEADEYFSEPV